LMVL
jgi:TolA-binding protein